MLVTAQLFRAQKPRPSLHARFLGRGLSDEPNFRTRDHTGIHRQSVVCSKCPERTAVAQEKCNQVKPSIRNPGPFRALLNSIPKLAVSEKHCQGVSNTSELPTDYFGNNRESRLTICWRSCTPSNDAVAGMIPMSLQESGATFRSQTPRAAKHE